MAWILIPIFVCGAIILFHRYQKKEKMLMFDNVLDLVQGQIETDVNGLKEAYEHFKSSDKIQIVKVKEQLWDFQKVTVNYIFDKAFIGEMDFRYQRWTPEYHAKMFLNEINSAK